MSGMMKKFLACLIVCGLMGNGAALAAVVDNGSDPDSRLNMRTEPSKDADSIGKFYSGTQVEILSDAGDGWAEVQIGTAPYCLSGYMMNEYLADSANVDATRDMEVISPYGTQSIVVRNRPSNSYDAVAMLEVGSQVHVIGTAGDYYYVRLSDDAVGCLSAEEVE